MGKFLTQDEVIARFRKVHGDKYDYSKVNYLGRKRKVCIICPEHGEFWITPDNHMNGHGCAECAGTKKLTLEEFIAKARLVHGDKFDYSKVEYNGNKKEVCIICPIHGEFWQIPNVHLSGHGCDKCYRESLKTMIFGVGINDSLSNSRSLSYSRWVGMLERCYGEDYQSVKSTYRECSVCEEWLTYSNFKKWFDENYVEGYQLDKDILVKGNKVYSPDTCCFVPVEINVLILRNQSRRGEYPIGVSKVGNRFRVMFSANAKYVRAGTFDTPEEAFQVYKDAKEKHIKAIATSYYKDGKITKRVYDALMNWTIEITD